MTDTPITLPDVAERIITDSLGFRLEVQLAVIAMDGRGRHKTYEGDDREERQWQLC